jgi:hypothetical protein
MQKDEKQREDGVGGKGREDNGAKESWSIFAKDYLHYNINFKKQEQDY